ncbi:unnamed protein product [Kluyveromyces dobzhanskii CBS 2104]|uniref:WGS project CCBQ000000000 data, contig 00015 n=1 Tax=Kluyveromyces dobzhanskii CBS 2104 TaxID=1427455 RepID=A0A0A8L984_9SACH|nr:unnamed protein product [Kluyveromyces dobzhanskii CBS 2104]
MSTDNHLLPNSRLTKPTVSSENGGASNTGSSFTPHLLLSMLVACLGSLQYGYHMGELNAPQDYITCRAELNPGYDDSVLGRLGLSQCIPLTDSQFGLITSIFSIGGLIGSLVAGPLADSYGRKPISYWNCSIGIFGAIYLFLSDSYYGMLLGRLLAGISCGSLIVITPLFINEMSPAHLKGSLGSMNQVSINCGILITQSLAMMWANMLQWRWILLFGGLISLVNFVLLFKINESPRWLVSQGNMSDAEDVLSQLRGISRQESRQEIDGWIQGSQSVRNFSDLEARGNSQPSLGADLHLDRPSSTRSSLRDSESITLLEYWNDPKYRYPRRVITTILMAQQFCGINSIVFYGVKVIKKAFPDTAIIINFCISLVNVLITFFSSPLVDHWGRKPLLISSSMLMSVCSFMICFGIIENAPVLLVTFVVLYISAFAGGLGPIPFLIISELSHSETVGVAQSYGTTMNWIATFAVGYGFPALNSIMDGYVFLLFSAVAVCFSVYVYKFVPETKGKMDYTDVWKNLDPRVAYIQ